MTIEPDSMGDEGLAPPDDTDALWAATGRMVNLRFLRGALRRRRRVWLACALVGLIVGAGYHVVVPLKYTATSTLYLAHAPGSDNTVVAQNDLAILDTPAVGQRAAALLRDKGLTPAKLLGKQPGTVASGNVLVISISGSSAKQAVQRVNAVAKAYLQFRAHAYRVQNEAVVGAAERQVSALQTKVNQLNAQIAQLSSSGGSQLTNLVAERDSDTAALVGVQQSIQADTSSTLSVIDGSHVIASGTVVNLSKKKALILDGLTGLVAGLGIGIILILAWASLSERVRRREDLAALLGVPVDLSIPTVRKRRMGVLPRSVLDIARKRERHVTMLANYFGELAVASRGAPVVVVTTDDSRVPGAALMIAAEDLVEAGRRVVFVDASVEHTVARALGVTHPGTGLMPLGGSLTVTLVVPPEPWARVAAGTYEPALSALSDDDAVFVLASLNVAVGAWHLRRWSGYAVMTVSSGESTVRHITTIAELLDAAGVSVGSAVLLDVDPLDDSPGLPVPGVPVVGRSFGELRTVSPRAQ